MLAIGLFPGCAVHARWPALRPAPWPGVDGHRRDIVNAGRGRTAVGVRGTKGASDRFCHFLPQTRSAWWPGLCLST